MENQITVVIASDGRVIHKEQNGVFRRSNGQNKLVALLDFPSSSVVKVNFLRPDGVKPKSQYMTYTEQQTYDGQTYSAYEYLLQAYQLNATGRLVVSLNIQNGATLATSGDFTIDVEASEAANDDVAPTDSNQYDEALESLMQTDAKLLDRTANVPNLVASIQKVAPNAFTYTNNSGVESNPIVIEDGETAPIPVNAASVVKIPADAWQAVYATDGTTVTGYTAVISAGLHGQMRDGATARDLWVSFDEAEQAAFKGAYEDYTVDAAGNITVSVTAPIDMTVRVWNGKGLRAISSQAVVRENNPPAFYEANDLVLPFAIFNRVPMQSDTFDALYADTLNNKIYQCVFEVVSVDGQTQTANCRVTDYIEATDFVGAETDRAKAAEAKLDAKIESNASAIQGLRDDVTEIESYIPSTTSAENQLADKAFVNSSINNMAAFYITYTRGSETQFGQAFPTAASLLNATTFYSGKDVRIPTQNDYATVLADETRTKGADGTYPTTRYSYQGGTYPNGQWAFQYVVNNTSLTQAQVDAINSGITAQKVASMDAAIDAKVNKAGDTMTGPLIISGDYFPHVQVLNTREGLSGYFEQSGGSLDIIARNASGENLSYVSLEDGIVRAHADLYENDQRVYSANNPPPYPVTSVNGMTGDVTVAGGGGGGGGPTHGYMDEDVLLEDDYAKQIYHDNLEALPKADFNSKLSVRDIYENRSFADLWAVIGSGDPYVWQAMRTYGIEEFYITGDLTNMQKWIAFAGIFPSLAGSRIYYQIIFLLKGLFGITQPINAGTAEDIWNQANAELIKEQYSMRNILAMLGMEYLSLEEDLADINSKMNMYEELESDASLSIHVRPTVCTTKLLDITPAFGGSWTDYINNMASTVGRTINSLSDLMDAVQMTYEIFLHVGCNFWDCTIERFPSNFSYTQSQIDEIFNKLYNNISTTDDENELFRAYLLFETAKMCYANNVVMQIHFFVSRNVNEMMWNQLGPNTGFDVIGDPQSINGIAKFLDKLSSAAAVPRIILYPMNPSNEQAILSLAGMFGTTNKFDFVMFGGAQGLNASVRGIRQNIQNLSDFGALGVSFGTSTYSSSITGLMQFDIYRRILASHLGELAQRGEYILGNAIQMAKDVAYNNVKEFLQLQE